MKPLKASLLALMVSSASSAWAETFRINDIRIEGLQRVSAGTVFASLPIQVGGVIDDQDIQSLSRALFRTGFFNDICIGRDGNVLVIDVKERPAISSIELDGNKAIKSEDLLRGLSDNGLAEGQIFKRATLEGLASELERQYVAQGRYSASVKAEAIDLPRNQVKLKITIDEGKVAKIKHVNIVGNHDFEEEELLDLFELGTGGWFPWFSSKNKYAKEKLAGDIERLESFYMDRGYLRFQVESTQVSLSPDKKSVYITLNINEGDVYKISEVELAGDLKISEDLIRRLILVREDQNFSQVLMTTSSEYITQQLGNAGYTFAEVEGIPEHNDEDKTVKVTFFVQPGDRAYVRRINFVGNSKTSDEVLRREMRQMESSSASTAAIEQSKVRLERLGFFKEVTVETKEVPGSNDLIDVEYTVEEQPSGSIGASVGYSDFSGVNFGANIQQNNWFGTGNSVGINVNKSRFQTNVGLNFNDPYFTPDGVSRGFNIYYRDQDYSEIGGANFEQDTYGADLTFGYPTSETSRISIGGGFRFIKLSQSPNSSQEIISTPFLSDNANRYITFEQGQNISALTFNPEGSGGVEVLSAEEIDELLQNPSGDQVELGEFANAVEFTENDPLLPDTVNNPSGFIDLNGNEFNLFNARIGWRQSTLNRGILANRGYSQSLNLEATVPGSELEYFKVTYNGQYFKPLTRNLTLRLRTDLGYADSYGNETTEVPFFEHFYAGGFGSVRGFERSTLSPRSTPPQRLNSPTVAIRGIDTDGDGDVDLLDGETEAYVLQSNGSLGVSNVFNERDRDRRRPFGGNILMEFGAELLFPIPFVKDQRSMQASFFVESGRVFDSNCNDGQIGCFDVDLEKMGSSYGIGLTWISGFGPLQFSIARPISQQEFDRTEFFQFSMGNTF